MDLLGSASHHQDSVSILPELPPCEGYQLPPRVVPALMQLLLDAWEEDSEIIRLTNLGKGEVVAVVASHHPSQGAENLVYRRFTYDRDQPDLPPATMADAPARANAAQLAARKIKSAKPKRGTNRSTPDNAGDAVFHNPAAQFGAVNGTSNMFGGGSSNGGALFGGGFNPPSSGGFNFTSNVPQISFGSPVTTPQPASQDSDDRADTTGEEAARRKKAFRTDEADRRNTPFTMSFGGAPQQFAQPASNLFNGGVSDSHWS